MMRLFTAGPSPFGRKVTLALHVAGRRTVLSQLDNRFRRNRSRLQRNLARRYRCCTLAGIGPAGSG